MSARLWNCFTPSNKPPHVSEGCYFSTDAGSFIARRGKYKRHWNAIHQWREGFKSFSVETKDEAKRLCERWAREAEVQQ